VGRCPAQKKKFDADGEDASLRTMLGGKGHGQDVKYLGQKTADLVSRRERRKLNYCKWGP